MAGSKRPKTKKPQFDEIRTAADYGIDIASLSANVKRTVTQRIKRHQIAFNTVQILRKAEHI